MRKHVFVALLAVGLLAGCGGGDKKDEGSGTDDAATKAVKYSQCMRENGVPSFPDPVNGRIQLKVEKGSDLDMASEGFKKAQEACKDLAPAGIGTAGQNPEQQERILKWVACMRQNGVPDMPDPQTDGRMLIGAENGIDPESQAFKDAQTKCRDLAPGGMPGGAG
ncbi:hypothetical protein [Paractinoplanes durhamensis]|uniref:Uncharacterized protein n=1 Tax=Paractinoplanes durhamensis TaxID=113563 RepID=A0ABQ3Z843_9ACTN|nr:hypothetical protein [Actinoplanes durhamensis]GIE05998.1 hypothetical protein Adu01nite_73480 [Actinoplanes durhamensis]